jgi:hypothetical protein
MNEVIKTIEEIFYEINDIGIETKITDDHKHIIMFRIIGNFTDGKHFSIGEIKETILRLNDYLKTTNLKISKIEILPPTSLMGWFSAENLSKKINVNFNQFSKLDNNIQTSTIDITLDEYDEYKIVEKKKLKKLRRYKDFIKNKRTSDKSYTWVPISNKNSPAPALNNIPISNTIN